MSKKENFKEAFKSFFKSPKKLIIAGVSLVLTAAIVVSSVLLVNHFTKTPEEEKLPPMQDPINDNYRTFYQVFVGSFSDSDGDTYGDLRGVINRFDYLNDGNINSGKSLGVQGIWLSPIFSSPSYHKYDAISYYHIDSRFGDMDDLRELADLCKSRNVKLILDLAINHTSTQHEWFQKFKQARQIGDFSDPYYDYYTCVTEEQKVGGRTYQPVAGTHYYYECNFSGDMPELNFDNPTVREEMLNVAKYYMEMGIDGFRFDAVKYIYFGDTEKTVDFWEWYMGELTKDYPDIYCVGECWSGESEILEYYSAMNCFNFAMSQAEGYAATAAKGRSAISNFTNYIESYQKKVLENNPEGMTMSFLSNHDMDRIAGTFVTENYMRMAANLYLLSPGSPTIYYGEEIGMRGSRGAANTDANRRLAMLWGDGDTVRNPIGSTYPTSSQITTTVADQIDDPNSLYNYYCKLLAIRHKYAAIARGSYSAVDCDEKNLGGFLITYGEEKLGLFHNTGSEALSVDLASCSDLAGHTFSAVLDAIGTGAATLEGTILTVAPQTSVILK